MSSWLSRIDRFSLGPIEGGHTRGVGTQDISREGGTEGARVSLGGSGVLEGAGV